MVSESSPRSPAPTQMVLLSVFVFDSRAPDIRLRRRLNRSTQMNLIARATSIDSPIFHPHPAESLSHKVDDTARFLESVPIDLFRSASSASRLVYDERESRPWV